MGHGTSDWRFNNEAEGHGGLLACLAAQRFHSEEVVIRGDSKPLSGP